MAINPEVMDVVEAGSDIIEAVASDDVVPASGSQVIEAVASNDVVPESIRTAMEDAGAVEVPAAGVPVLTPLTWAAAAAWERSILEEAAVAGSGDIPSTAADIPVPVDAPMEVDEGMSSAPSGAAGSGVWGATPSVAAATEESAFPSLETALAAGKPKRPIKGSPPRTRGRPITPPHVRPGAPPDANTWPTM